MKNFVKNAFVSTLAAASLIIGQLPAEAKTGTTRYTFGNNRAGHVGVEWVKVTRYAERNRPDYTDTKIRIRYAAPTCGHRYYLYGNIYVKYNSPTGKSTGWKLLDFHNSKVTNYEGVWRTKTVYSSKGLKHSGGRVWIKDDTECKPLSPLRDVTPDLPGSNDVRRELDNCLSGGCDPSGIFW